MNKELAKTLTTALVQFIDRERPEGTMCCSNGECVSLEKAFTEENFDSVETFIKKKLSGLTEFETHLKWLIENGGSGIEHVKVGANELLALAKKELERRNEVIILDKLSYDKEPQDGKAEAVADLNFGWGCDGTYCTNPHHDCINCPRKTTGGSISTSSASGTSTVTLHGNTSTTDGKEHNPSFTD